MHTRASNSKLVKPLPEPERTLNQRLRRRNRRVPFEQRNKPPAQPKVVYASILDINYFRHFLDILENYNLMDDELMWAADRVVAPTPGSAITISETANEFAIKGNHLTLVKGNQFDARNEQVNAVFTRSGKSYDPPINPNDQPTNSETPVNFDSEDEDEEPTLQPKPKDPKPVKETPTPKPYKPKISYPQCLRKEKMEAQYGKFLDMIQAVRINVPLVDVLAGMPNYGKFFKELVSNKHKLEQISATFLSDESSVLIQNKVPPKLGDPESFLIPCNFNKAFSCDALADLGASINLMPYCLYAKLSLKTLKPTKMSVRLADRSFQYPVGIAENMLVEVGKFTFLVDFVILEMKEDSKVPLILGRTFLHTDDAVIQVKQKQLNFRVGTECMTFHMDPAMKHSYSNDDTCFSIDIIDEILEEDFDALLDEGSKILYSIEGTILEEKLIAEFDEFIAMTADENSESESDTKEPPFKKITFNTDYKIKTSLEEPPTDLELKPLPDYLEYAFLEEPSFLHLIISSQLSEENKNKLIFVLKSHKQDFAWKTTDIPSICPSFCKHKIQLLDDKSQSFKSKDLHEIARRAKPTIDESRPFEVVERVDLVAYRSCLPQELVGIHDTFHVSNLKKCLANVNLYVSLEEIKIDGKLRFVEEPIEIMDREVKKLKQSWIPIVKVRWNSRRGPKFTWEQEVETKRKYP
ncbi:reverse transcriptase domain-containing protein [Tanacetum coccineum]